MAKHLAEEVFTIQTEMFIEAVLPGIKPMDRESTYTNQANVMKGIVLTIFRMVMELKP